MVLFECVEQGFYFILFDFFLTLSEVKFVLQVERSGIRLVGVAASEKAKRRIVVINGSGNREQLLKKFSFTQFSISHLEKKSRVQLHHEVKKRVSVVNIRTAM